MSTTAIAIICGTVAFVALLAAAVLIVILLRSTRTK